MPKAVPLLEPVLELELELELEWRCPSVRYGSAHLHRFNCCYPHSS